MRARRSEAYDGGGKRYRRLEEGEDRGSDTRELTSQVAPGALKRLSTAVFVDTSRAADLAKVRELAGAAIGYDARRGDTLVVEAVDFHHDVPARRDVWWLLYGTVVPLIPVLVAAVAAVLCTRLALPPAVALLRSLLERGIVERATKAAAGFRSGSRAQHARARAAARRCGDHQRASRIDRYRCARALSAARARGDRRRGCSARIRRCSTTRTNCCAAMPEEFVRFATFLRPARRPEEPRRPPVPLRRAILRRRERSRRRRYAQPGSFARRCRTRST